jgi:hypothetical protein
LRGLDSDFDIKKLIRKRKSWIVRRFTHSLTSTANGFIATTFNGTDVWKRIALTAW